MASDTHRVGHLHLLETPETPAVITSEARFSLASSPFRPGELPVISWVRLDLPTQTVIREAAKAAGIPGELWIRIAAEASRLVSELSSKDSAQAQQITAHLDEATRQKGSRGSLESPALTHYADQLERGGAYRDIPPDLPLRLPEEMTGSWRRSAASTRRTMPQWIGERVADAPRHCVSWEITAARNFQSLGEWFYASFLIELNS